MMRRGAEQRRNRMEPGAVLVMAIGAVAALAMLALIWVMAGNQIDGRTAAVRLAAEQRATGDAVLLAEEQRDQMMMIDQALIAMRAAWRIDPAHFRLSDWPGRLPGMAGLAPEFFLTDAKGVIIADTEAQAIGLGIGSRALASHGEMRTVQDKALFGATAPAVTLRTWSMTLGLPLHNPDGSPAGTIGIFYQTDVLARFYAGAGLGDHAFAALIETTDGVVNAVAGPAAAASGNTIAQTPMFAALRDPRRAVWIGASALDNVRRIHAFHDLEGWKLAVAVGLDEQDAMAPARNFALTVNGFAATASAVVLLAMGWLVREILFRRSLTLARRTASKLRGEVEAAGVEARAAKGEARFLGGQLAVLGENLESGWAAFDTNFDLAATSPAFAALSGLAPEALATGTSLEAVLRTAAAQGAFGEVDIEAEIEARMARAKSGEAGGESWHLAGGQLELQRLPIDGGGLVLLFPAAGAGSEWA